MNAVTWLTFWTQSWNYTEEPLAVGNELMSCIIDGDAPSLRKPYGCIQSTPRGHWYAANLRK